MLIGIVSDTHGNARTTLEAVRLFEAYDLEALLHCGDIGAPIIPPLLSDWPAHYVLGNVDRDEQPLRDAIERSGGICHGRFAELTFDTVHVALLHGDDAPRLRQAIESGRYQLVCHGHTHRITRRRVGSTLVLNPGALHRARPHSAAVVELPSLEVTLLEF